MTTIHIPILLDPIRDGLIEPFRRLPDDAPPHWIVDCTLGGGGHTSAFLEAFAREPALQRHKVLGVDQDPSAIERAKERFATEIQEGRLELVKSRFSEISPVLENRPILGILADLGFSSDQMGDASRGLSFQSEGPLDMRLDPTSGVSCRDFLARISEIELEKILVEYGEERFARRIARVITERRARGELPKTTKELADWVVRAIPPPARHGRIHAATRTFQALRIAVNEELQELDSLLNEVMLSLKVGGRIAILSFHSLEDRRVKQTFRSSEAFEPLTKKPQEASEEEVARNPRSRSAKLRIAERVC